MFSNLTKIRKMFVGPHSTTEEQVKPFRSENSMADWPPCVTKLHTHNSFNTEELHSNSLQFACYQHHKQYPWLAICKINLKPCELWFTGHVCSQGLWTIFWLERRCLSVWHSGLLPLNTAHSECHYSFVTNTQPLMSEARLRDKLNQTNQSCL